MPRAVRLLPLLLAILSCRLAGSSVVATPPVPAVAQLQAPSPTHTAVPEAAYIPPACVGLPRGTAAPALVPTPTQIGADLTPIDLDTQLRVLDAVGERVRSVYVYPDFGGLDWEASVQAVRAKVRAGMDTSTFYRELDHLISSLGDEHSKFESPVEVAASEAELQGDNEYVGVGVLGRPLPEKGRLGVLAVFPGSPAFFGGLLPHDSILALDGIPVVTEGVAHPERLRGPACSEVVLSVESPGQNTREIRLVRTSVSGPIPIESHLVPAEDGRRIGYIFLPTFFDKQIPAQVEQALHGFGELDGLILDNRMNGGGSSSVLEPVLGLFASGRVGSYLDRDGQRPLEISPHPINNSQTVALAVLIGPDTVSYGEVFAGILRDIGRAVLVGEPTAGNVETLHGYSFEDGSRLWIAEESFDPAVSHANWEAEGLVPDVRVEGAWEDFSFEQDPTVAAALRALP